MKRLLLFITLISCSLLQAHTIEKVYRFNEPTVNRQNGDQLLIFANTLNTGTPGAPTLPYQSVSLLLPPGEAVDKVEFIGAGEITLPGQYKLAPAQYARPVSAGKSGETIKDENLYQTNANYPAQPLSEISTRYMNGYAMGMGVFTPVKYNPVTGQVSYYSEVTIRIETRPNETAKQALNNLKTTRSIQKKIEHLSQNAQLLADYPQTTSRSDDYDILIVTGDNYLDSFDELTGLYLKEGLQSEVVSTTAMESMEGQDLAEKIRNYIIQEYQDHSIQYVMLGGDIDIIPYRGFFCEVQSSSLHTDDNIPADLYYSALDGNWNTDGDNLWGEIGEDDLLPEVSVARFSFSTPGELANMLHKTISYQTNPVLGELDNPLMAGEHLYDDPLTWGADYMELLIGHHEDNGYTTDGIPETDPYETLYDRDATWSGSTIMARINDGHSFIYHSGHSNAFYTMKLNSSDITNENFYNVNGEIHNYTFVYTHGCICGAFDENDCIAERMVSIENFLVAGAFNSRYGWFNEGQTEGPSEHINREFVDALYAQKINRIGETHKISKQETASWVNAPGQHEEGALRWCFYDCNMFGDPALQIWTADPIQPTAEFTNTLPIGTNTLDVTVSATGASCEGLTCAFVKDGVLYGKAITDENGVAHLSFETPLAEVGDAFLYVSGYNCSLTEFPASVIPAGGAYVVYESHELNDATGNNNSLADFGESLLLSLSLHNAGLETANNLSVALSTDDTYISFTDNTETVTIIEGESTVNLEDAFAFDVDELVPDQHETTINITVTGSDTWTSNFTITLQAPHLQSGSAQINDAGSGNGNGMPDPGETLQLILPSINSGHSDLTAVTGTLTSSSNEVSIDVDQADLGTLASGETKNAAFTVTFDEDAALGSSIEFTYEFGSGEYTYETNFYITVGIINEDFETGDFSKFDWNIGGTYCWLVDTENPYQGTHCMHSADIDDHESSEISIAFEVLAADSIRFFKKVSSEGNYDFLRFYVDNVKLEEWSGEVNWSKSVYPIDAGEHTFTWRYEKDSYSSAGSDRAWVDFITFPPVFIPLGIAPHNNALNALTVYPNPCSEKTLISWEQTQDENIQLRIFNQMGQQVRELPARHYAAGKQQSEIQTQNLASGLYFVQIQSNTLNEIIEVMVK